jgi:hypothetical protein
MNKTFPTAQTPSWSHILRTYYSFASKFTTILPDKKQLEEQVKIVFEITEKNR